LLPTASGLEPNGPTHWNDLGLRHFTALGVADVRPTRIIDAKSAADPSQLDLLRGANFFYLSGGNPQYTVETLRNSPAWDIIARAHANGSVLAGCSAGAMAMGGRTVALRLALTGDKVDWKEALGTVPQIIVFPHFDRMPGFVTAPVVRKLLGGIPKGFTAAGIDEDTALVRVAAVDPDDPAHRSRWRVMGRQTVTLVEGTAPARVLKVDDEVLL
jgi:cyanophycinase